MSEKSLETEPCDPCGSVVAVTFADLVASRKRWIEQVLKPWARGARRDDLRRAEAEWIDLAGKVDPQKTLWLWAWSRFPALVHEELGIDEAVEVTVRLRDGREFTGYPDSRQSAQGQLVLVRADRTAGGFVTLGPFSLDEIVAVDRGSSDSPPGLPDSPG